MATRDKLSLWVYASIVKHFSDAINDIDVFIEGQIDHIHDTSDWCELRIDGPWLQEVSNNVIIVRSEVNVLIGTVIDSTNLYKESMNHTKIIPAFTNVCVYRYGPSDDEENDASYVGELILQPVDNVKERIEIARFGQIHPSVRLLQSTIEGHFKMTLFV